MKRKEILDRMGLCLPPDKQIRVVISSDVSNEADDPFAIVHQLLTPIFDVRGVIATHYEGKTRGDRRSMENSYRMLTALMAATGMTDVPMLRGCAVPLAGELDVPDAEGVRFLIEEAQRDDPRPLYVTVQGALTDVAAALNRCPAIAGKMTVVWIGGMPYPKGGCDFNMKQDLAAARAVFGSKVALWQLPVNVYGTVEVTMAEMALKIRPCGTAGRYLYDLMEQYNLTTDEPYTLRKGESWNFGDSPVVAALLGCDLRQNFHMEPAPVLADGGRYLPGSGRAIRVYDSVDVRFCWRTFCKARSLLWAEDKQSVKPRRLGAN